MKLTRKYYPIACVVCFIMIIVFSSIHAYKPKFSKNKKEGFIDHINEFTNKNKRKLETFKKDVNKVSDEGFRAVKKLFRK